MIGSASGAAVILPSREGKLEEGAGQQLTPGRQGQPVDQRQGFEGMIPLPEGGIQLDEAGMHGMYLDARRKLIDAATDYKVNAGVDLTQPSTWTRPEDIQAGETFMAAYQRVNAIGERLKQGLANQKAYQEAHMEGKIRTQGDPMSDGTLTYGRMNEETYSTNFPFVDEQNKILALPATSEADYGRKLGQYSAAVQDIQARLQTGDLLENEAKEMIASLHRPARYQESEIDKQRLRNLRDQNSRAWGAYNEERAVNLEPAVQAMNALGNASRVVAGAGSDLDPGGKGAFKDGSALQGFSYRGGKEMPVSGVYAYGGGRGAIAFDVPEVVTVQLDAVANGQEVTPGQIRSLTQDQQDLVLNLVDSESSGKLSYKNGRILVEYDEDNMMPVMASIMSAADYQKMMSNPQFSKYLDNGVLTQDGIRKWQKEIGNIQQDPDEDLGFDEVPL